jgi:hypothetical protein
VKLGETLSWKATAVSVNDIERLAKSLFKVQRSRFESPDVTSGRTQLVYDYVMSMAMSDLSRDEKVSRLSEFIKELVPEDMKERAELLTLVGAKGYAPPQPPDFDKLGSDPAISMVLARRFKETQACVDAHACTASFVMMGGLLEGALLAVVSSRAAEALKAPSCPKKDGEPKKFHDWTLPELLTVAHECGWAETDGDGLPLEVRNYRSLVHPWNERVLSFETDRHNCIAAWMAVQQILSELSSIDSNWAARQSGNATCPK